MSIKRSSIQPAAGNKRRKPVKAKKVEGVRKPLNAYNIFFKIGRKFIIEGKDPRDITPEDVRLTELENKARHRHRKNHDKTHGKVTFKEMALRIAEAWKEMKKCHHSPVMASLLEKVESDKNRYQLELQQNVRHDCQGTKHSIEERSQVRQGFSLIQVEPQNHDMVADKAQVDIENAIISKGIQRQMMPPTHPIDPLDHNGDEFSSAKNNDRQQDTPTACFEYFDNHSPYPIDSFQPIDLESFAQDLEDFLNNPENMKIALAGEVADIDDSASMPSLSSEESYSIAHDDVMVRSLLFAEPITV